jgi:leucyl-tRNA synthetase
MRAISSIFRCDTRLEHLLNKNFMKEYNHQKIEQKWRKRWREQDIYRTNEDAAGEPYFCLDMFPGISGSHLHVGHFMGYTISDVKSRFARLQGKNVLHPMGWDAFGLPVENFAIKNNIHPQQAKDDNKVTMKAQLEQIAAMYDWDREVDTSDPAYYKWTQWVFLQMHKAGLAYRAEAPVNWCPNDKTVLANEQVVNGECDRCGTSVEKKSLKQWFFGITKYADRLEADLAHIDWPERTKKMQRDWIGKSHGMEIEFAIKGSEAHTLKVFTTRPDTLYGATFLVVAPEHLLISEIVAADNKKEVDAYIRAALNKSERERMETTKKTGVFTGAYAINPANNTEIPIWVADYVLGGYGTGAIMAVPAHDQRDFDFATSYKLPIIEVIERPADAPSDVAYTSADGLLKNSQEMNGMPANQAQEVIAIKGESEGWGRKATTYKMRDWLFSRQRYWGAPIPIIHCETCGEVPVPEDQLPVLLPQTAEYKPRDDGRSPLANVPEFVNVTCPKCNADAKRETDTMDGFVCSSWYFLRYTTPHDTTKAFDKKMAAKWMPVDLYVGGAEHSVGHLMYARFFTKFLYDKKLVTFNEPFQKLFHQGTIYRDGAKMSKSKGNVVNPDEIVEVFGADSLRTYELFMGPADQAIEWSDKGIEGIYRFLGRCHRLVVENSARTTPAPQEIDSLLHRTIDKVTKDIESFHFNTAISAMMEFVGEAKEFRLEQSQLEQFITLLAPFAPLLADELWEELGHAKSIWTQGVWPKADPAKVRNEHTTIAIQINGKLRGTVIVATGTKEDVVVTEARNISNVATHLEGKTIRKTIFVADKLVNFVVS